MHLPLIALERINVHLDLRHVLHDVTWRLERGEQWAIVGSNGSGKTTLLKVIRGDQWIDRDGGERNYALDGTSESVRSAASRIGYVSPEQQEHISRLQLGFPGRDLVAAGLYDTLYLQGRLTADEEARVDALLDRFALQAIAARPLTALSFGELRRLLIARALVSAPPVLVLDEFTNGMDRRSRAVLLAFLEQVASETQIVCSSHRFDDLPATTTQHATVVEGRIVEVGAGRPTARASHAARRSFAAAHPHPHPHEPGELLVAIHDADVYRGEYGETLVLQGIDWEIRRGEHTVIHGENGSGKSTFAGVLAGTLPAAYGARITRFGSEGPFDLWELKKRIVHVSDALQIAYDVSPLVETVIATGFAASIGTIEQKPDIEQLHAAEALLERLGLQKLAGRPFLALSFGERRKVLIARGLVRRPDLLILDEVWSGLDAAFRGVLSVLLDELVAAGTTVVMISHHDDDLPAFIRRSYHVEQGRLAPTPSASHA
jgi:molybdate transport system ATP-binding protein